MKRLIALALVLGLPALAGIPPRVNGRVVYQDVVEQAGTPAELQARAEAWARANLDPTTVKVADGSVVGRGQFAVPFHMGLPLIIRFSATVEARDGRYRYTFTDFTAAGVSQPQQPPMEEMWTKDGSVRFGGGKGLEGADKGTLTLIAGLKKAMAQPAASW